MARSILLAATTLALALAAAAPASASRAEMSVRVESCPKAMCATTVFQTAGFVAAPGERNAVAVRPEEEAVVFEDAGAVLEAGRGCERIDDHTARCRFTPLSLGTVRLLDTTVALGDGDDTLVVDEAVPTLSADGGAGADTLAGSPGPERLNGGAGQDTVLGGDGDDQLVDAAASAADAYDGGAGVDLLDYGEHRRALAVDLTAGRGDAGDRVAAIENLRGGTRGDDLRGDAGDNALMGGTGPDRLSGGDGNDKLEGEGGRDILAGEGGNDALTGDLDAYIGGRLDAFSGGDGDDVIYTADRRAERPSCGAGVDSVSGTPTSGRSPDPSDVIGADCERVGVQTYQFAPPTRFDWVAAHPLAVTRRRIVLAAPCVRCRGEVRVLAGKRVLGKARVGRRERIVIRLRRRHPATIRLRWWIKGRYAFELVRFTVPLKPR
jgi:hypothetical protein